MNSRTAWKVWASQFLVSVVMLFLLLFVLVGTIARGEPGQASARGQVCGPGKICTSRQFVAKGTGGGSNFCDDTTNAAWAWQASTSNYVLRWFTTGTRCATGGANVLGVNVNDYGVRANSAQGFFVSGTSGQGFQSGAAGTAAAPSFTWQSDANTGLYNLGADQLGVSTAGLRSFAFTSTPGVLEGSSANGKLSLNDGTGAELNYAGVLFRLAGGAALFAGGGLQVSSTRTPATFATATAANLQVDSTTGRAYWQSTAEKRALPMVDLGGAAHPALQQKTYVIEVGHGSTAAMTYDVAPRAAAGAVTIATVDAAAAGATTAGNNIPYKWNARRMNTAAAAGSISSMASSAAWIHAQGTAPRWCQRVWWSTLTNTRTWLGLASALPGSSDNPAISFMGFRYSTTAGDTAIMYCTGSGASVSCTTTGVTPNNGTGTGFGGDLLCVDNREGTAVTYWVNGAAVARVTSGLPPDFTMLMPIASVEARAAALTTLDVGRVTIEVN